MGHGVGAGVAVVGGDDDVQQAALGRPPRSWTLPPISARVAIFLGLRASNSSSTRGRPWVISPPATPPVWKVRMVSWVPGSPMDCAAMMPTASPGPQACRWPGSCRSTWRTRRCGAAGQHGADLDGVDAEGSSSVGVVGSSCDPWRCSTSPVPGFRMSWTG